MSSGSQNRLRKAVLAGAAGLTLLFGAACNDAGGEEGGENGGVVENGGELEEGGDG